jgi:hypothetical protein
MYRSVSTAKNTASRKASKNMAQPALVWSHSVQFSATWEECDSNDVPEHVRNVAKILFKDHMIRSFAATHGKTTWRAEKAH